MATKWALLQNFGNSYNWNWLSDQFLVKIVKIWSQWQSLLGKNRLFNDWIMQEMAPHCLGRTTLLHKSVLPIAMIFSMIIFLEKSYQENLFCIGNDSTFSKNNVFSLLGQILYQLAFFHITHKKEERKDRHCDVTENMWCHLTVTVGRWFPPFCPWPIDIGHVTNFW